MRVVIDTSVFIGACMGVGAPNRVIRECSAGQFSPLMGTAILSEYEDVLGRQSLFQGCRLTRNERDELLDVFLARCQWTRIFYGWRRNLADEADNHLVELAVAGNARRIVTRNLADLESGELQFRQFVVMTPERLLQEMNQSAR